MSNILVIAPSAFGKTTSLIPHPEFGIKGLNPAETYILSVTKKDLPGKGTRKLYPVFEKFNLNTKRPELKDYRRLVLSNWNTRTDLIVHALDLLGGIDSIKNIVLDDANYIMQDYYMAKSLSTGWDAPKKIGHMMGRIFDAIEKLPNSKNFIMMAHGEEYDTTDQRKGYRFKTTGKAVQEYITPEGKFDIVLIGRSRYDDSEKKAIKEFVTEDDGFYATAKSHGAFGTLYILNDMALVIEKVNAYYDGI